MNENFRNEINKFFLFYSPTTVIIQETTYEVPAIQTIHMINVIGHNLCLFFLLQSGMVTYKTNDIGNEKKKKNFDANPSGMTNIVSPVNEIMIILFTLHYIFYDVIVLTSTVTAIFIRFRIHSSFVFK